MEEIIEKNVVFSGKTLKVDKIKVDLKNGKTAKWELASFNNQDNHGSVGIVAINQKKEIILIKYFHPGVDSRIITIPGGGVKKDETELVAANKELIEETGFQAKKLTKVADLSPVPGYLQLTTSIYLAQDLSENKSLIGDEIEDIEILKIPFDKAVEMCLSNEIIDSRTISAILIVAGSSLLA